MLCLMVAISALMVVMDGHGNDGLVTWLLATLAYIVLCVVLTTVTGALARRLAPAA